MSALIVLRQMLAERWRSLVAWTLGTVALVVVMVLFFPSIEDSGADFDAYMQSLPESLRDTLGVAGASLSSPVGYLMSQLYSNMYPLLILVMALAAAVWTIAGAESDGTLEMTLAAPLTRWSLAAGRFAGVAITTLAVTAVSTGALAILSPVVDLQAGIPSWGLWSAGLTMWAMVMLYAGLAFGVGAAFGHKALALGIASAVAVTGFLGQVFASLADALEFLRTVSPWYWFLGSDPLTTAPSLRSLLLPLVVCLAFAIAGTWLFTRRDLGT